MATASPVPRVYVKNQAAERVHVALHGDELAVRTPDATCTVPLPVPVSDVRDVRVVPAKVEVTLSKRSAGSASAAAQEAAPRRASKWDRLDVDEDAPPAGSGDAELQAFFQKLYADADPDTRRAMVKSFQESGGTALSTNWAEVGRQTVPVQAPQGMEVRQYEQ
ncbi:unnamed protein product [Malassezia sympodialis ATCC 42132]|uniref:uncharacterized protein n=1 Tax=Malassezia sympodialis (strain ATCC 42132) TaxID=1230383 RepID=UPI0002C1FD5D|nr:uncharacterized protein MSY001_3197 [Malassezia sympodialis ATCC 42132]CCV00492.1 unnamed protein product [Malassezia sympodialis ATCC 42132]|eukprot:XP_018741686.1 uncharacterized protein MSY001_3197 [Malassezia sympodialis ATCC 42132]